MTKFRSSFMMKSPLYEHGEKLRKEAMRLSKESSGRDDAPDFDNPEVVKLWEDAKKADKSHGSDSPAQMATASYRRTPMDTETYYGGEIDVPDITSVGKLAGYGIDSAVGAIFGGKKGAEKMVTKSAELKKKLGASSNQCGPGTKMENGQCVPE